MDEQYADSISDSDTLYELSPNIHQPHQKETDLANLEYNEVQKFSMIDDIKFFDDDRPTTPS